MIESNEDEVEIMESNVQIIAALEQLEAARSTPVLEVIEEHVRMLEGVLGGLIMDTSRFHLCSLTACAKQ